jgi:putative ABC transport system permease protein
VRVGNEKFRPTHAYVTDKDVFTVFDFKLIEGNSSQALAQPHSVVLSRSLARKYYGEKSPIGKDIFLIGDYDKTETLHHVTGVMEDVPSNTHLPVDMLISFRDNKERTGWAYSYLLLQEGATISQVESSVRSFIKKYDTEEEGKDTNFIFQPINDIHLTSHLAREITPGGESLYVRVVGFAGMLVLLMAVINFTNLNSAMSLSRAKEFGMRKVMGASRKQLIYYLATESVIIHLTAALLAGGVVYLLFPYIQQFVAIQLLPSVFAFFLATIIVALVMGVASSLYPVILLTAIQPMAVLKTSKAISITGRESAFSLKRIMVTAQFGISILLIGSAAIAYHQFNFLLHKNLGIKREQVIAIPAVPDGVKDKFESFRNRLIGQPGIVSVSACIEVPSREIRDSGPVLIDGANSDPTKAPRMDIQVIDHNVVSLLGLQLIAGRNILPSKTTSIPEFTESYTFQQYLLAQSREYLINETAMHQLGWDSAQEAIGQKISWSLGDMALASGPIVGIVRDFHQETLKNKVDPIIMVCEPLWLRTFLIKAEASNIQSSVEKISLTWNELFPFYPMEYFFLDDLYNNLYKAEHVQVQLLFGFSGIAILIAFTGLIGLVAYALKTRTKEMAVRKVLGATAIDLIQLMSYEYLIVLLLGAVLAIPLSIYGLGEWLSSFAYHVPISPLSYAFTLISILTLLLVTVGIQTLRASKANPAETLRDE